MRYDAYAIGTGYNATSLTLIEDITGTPATMRPPGRRVPILGPVSEETLDGGVQYNGDRNAMLYIGGMPRAALDALVAATTGSYETAYAECTFVAPDERWRWGTFNAKVWLPRDLADTDPGYDLIVGGNVTDVLLPFHQCRNPLTSLSATASLTATQRYVKVSTASGNVTITLPAASSLTNVVISIIKTSSSNTLTVQRAGTDTVESGTSISLTSLNERADLRIDSGTDWQRIT